MILPFRQEVTTHSRSHLNFMMIWVPNSAIVYYSVWSEDFPANQLFRWGHYKRNGGTKSNVLAADVLDIKSADVSGLEMEMLKGRGTPVKFVNASTDTSAENGLFAVVQGTEPKARSRISSMPTMQISAYCESKWVEETQEWEDTYTFILPEEYDSYSFGVYTDTHDKQFYWDGEAFTEEASVSKVYDFEEMKDVPLSYDGIRMQICQLGYKIFSIMHGTGTVHLNISMIAIFHQGISQFMLPFMMNIND